MHFSFLFLVIAKCSILSVHAKYNKDVVCVIDKDQYPVCTLVASPSRRNELNSTVDSTLNSTLKNTSNSTLKGAEVVSRSEPSYDPYIPRSHSVFYNCTPQFASCEPIKLLSLTQITNPHLNLRTCFQQSPAKFECGPIRYYYFKNVDKLLFLKENIQNKKFYLVDCLIFKDNSRVCHSKNVTSYAALADLGTLMFPDEKNILSQEEFLCEESDDKEVTCDMDPYVPYPDGLRLKQAVKIEGDVFLKTGSFAIMLSKKCIDSWCGYSGRVLPSRRTWFQRYDPPGGKVFRCYHAKRQQICKLLYDKYKETYNERGYLSSW